MKTARSALRPPASRHLIANSSRNNSGLISIRRMFTPWSRSNAPRETSFSRNKRWLAYAGSGGSLLTVALLLQNDKGDQAPEDPRDIERLSDVPWRKLCSGWVAFAFCSSPTWVDMSESVYGALSRIPVLSSIVQSFVLGVFVDQFLGGQTIDDCLPKIESLRNHGVGTLLGYNIEAELDGSSKNADLIVKQTQHVLNSIDAQGALAKQYWQDSSAGNSDNRCWVRIKVTGLLSHPVALSNGSTAILESRRVRGLDVDVPSPGLPHDGDWNAALTGQGTTPADREQLLHLRATLEAIASKARDNRVRVVIDAEQSWYQPVIDALTDELMQTYNALDGPPTVIASFQAYLRRHPQLIDQQFHRAKEKGYKLLFKQVRGAYMVTEAKRSEQEPRSQWSPVWRSKAETDASFDYGVEKTMATIAQEIRDIGHSTVGAVFATHNTISIDKAIQSLKENGLVERTDESDRLVLLKEAARNIAFAQLYGLKDDLTNKITGTLVTDEGMPLVVKSMSYGDLKECLPFLARRATENKAVLEGRGGAIAERSRLGREISRRLWPTDQAVKRK